MGTNAGTLITATREDLRLFGTVFEKSPPGSTAEAESARRLVRLLVGNAQQLTKSETADGDYQKKVAVLSSVEPIFQLVLKLGQYDVSGIVNDDQSWAVVARLLDDGGQGDDFEARALLREYDTVMKGDDAKAKGDLAIKLINDFLLPALEHVRSTDGRELKAEFQDDDRHDDHGEHEHDQHGDGNGHGDGH